MPAAYDFAVLAELLSGPLDVDSAHINFSTNWITSFWSCWPSIGIRAAKLFFASPNPSSPFLPRAIVFRLTS